eukprot:TRINITY_DN2032_c0_g1_i4.p1 TRINITY_DN2032_c0_g1~~TRINITY_DN2032_c0_g1_i4.p1  ORF type:complete len:849 (+),score=148.56 TRINITY_DN2032_c0_g1_i4:1199-3745(+)
MVKFAEKAAWISLHSIKLSDQHGVNVQDGKATLCIEATSSNDLLHMEAPITEQKQKGVLPIDRDLFIVFDESALQYPNPKNVRVEIKLGVTVKPGNYEVGSLRLKIDAIKPLRLDQGQQELQLGNSDARLCLTLRVVDRNEVPSTVQQLGQYAYQPLNGNNNNSNGNHLLDSRDSSSIYGEANPSSVFDLESNGNHPKGLLAMSFANLEESGSSIVEQEEEDGEQLDPSKRPLSAEPMGSNVRRWLQAEENHRRTQSHVVRYEAPDFGESDMFMDFHKDDDLDTEVMFKHKSTQTDLDLLKHYILQLATQGQLNTETLQNTNGDQRVIPVFFVIGNENSQQQIQDQASLHPFGSLLQTRSTELQMHQALAEVDDSELGCLEEMHDEHDLDLDDDDIFAGLIQDHLGGVFKHYRAMSDVGEERERHDPEDFFKQGTSAPSTFPVDFHLTRRMLQQHYEYEHENSQNEDIRSYNYTPEVEDIMWHRKNLRPVEPKSATHNMYSTIQRDERGEDGMDDRCFTPASDFYPVRVSSALSNSVLPPYFEAPPVLQTLNSGSIPDNCSRPSSRAIEEERRSDDGKSSRLSNDAFTLNSRFTPIRISQQDFIRDVTSTPSLRRVVPKTPRNKKEQEALPEWVALAKAKQIKIQSFSKASEDIEQALSSVFQRRNGGGNGGNGGETRTRVTPSIPHSPLPVPEEKVFSKRPPLKSVSSVRETRDVQNLPNWRLRGGKIGRSTTIAGGRFSTSSTTATPVGIPEWQLQLKERKRKQQDGLSVNSESSMISVGRQESVISAGSNRGTPIPSLKTLRRVETSKELPIKNAPHLSGKVRALKNFFDFSRRSHEEDEAGDDS